MFLIFSSTDTCLLKFEGGLKSLDDADDDALNSVETIETKKTKL